MWYEWQSMSEFDSWHDSLCQRLGYPITPVNAETGLPDDAAQKVTAYTTPILVESKVIAWVESSQAENLVLTQLRPQTIRPTGI